MSKVRLENGDCSDVLKTIEDNSVDSIVTDPPYGLNFMNKKWDYDVPSEEIWRECLRVLKPGGHLLSFGGSRTYHRLACAVEDAGFEIRDQIMWVYGSGWPKSHNGEWGGTALKPAHEPIVVARKALIGTVEKNWREYSTGALNIDGCRVGTENPAHDCGRWPANLIHDGSEEVLSGFPETTSGSIKPYERKNRGGWVGATPEISLSERNGDTGSAARFFYVPKASKKDREEGLDGFTSEKTLFASGTGLKNNGDGTPRNQTLTRKNIHPTVKPTNLMRYLCRLVTPGGGIVLDPFMGSGSTGKAAVLEGFDFIGIEMDADYVKIAEARIAAVQKSSEEL